MSRNNPRSDKHLSDQTLPVSSVLTWCDTITAHRERCVFKFISLFICFVASVCPAGGVTAAPDSISHFIPDAIAAPVRLSSEQFRWRKLIAPAALVAVGAIGVGNGWFRHINSDVKAGMKHMRGTCYYHADDYLQYITAASYLGIGFIPGNKGKHNFKERLCAGVTAYAAMAIVVNVTKTLVKERRPDNSTHNSFPSGHTATVFTGAELMRLEYGPWVGLGGYAVATGVAFLRLYNNRHWLNDVVAGAGIGILCANIGYWLLPFERKLFKIKSGKQLAVMPTVGADMSAGLALSASF